MTDKSWMKLTEKLSLVHTKPHPQLSVIKALKGWISYLGPCFPQLGFPKTYTRISSLALTQAFDEIPSCREAEALWQRAYARWCRTRLKVWARP